MSGGHLLISHCLSCKCLDRKQSSSGRPAGKEAMEALREDELDWQEGYQGHVHSQLHSQDPSIILTLKAQLSIGHHGNSPASLLWSSSSFDVLPPEALTASPFGNSKTLSDQTFLTTQGCRYLCIPEQEPLGQGCPFLGTPTSLKMEHRGGSQDVLLD